MVDSAAALLNSLLDYAGTFPPASLPLEKAVENYRSALDGSHRQLVGRLVMPTANLAALQRLSDQAPHTPWPVTAILGGDLSPSIDSLIAHHAAAHQDAPIVSVEVPPIAATDIRAVKRKLPSDLDVFFEVPIDADFERRVGAIASVAGCAKLRTGGVTSTAFPTSEGLARVITHCGDAGIPFKATAGLHHTVRGCYRLTYAPDSSEAMMHGFLNVCVAAALVYAGAGLRDVDEVLVESFADAFRFDEGALRWRGWEIRTADLVAARSQLFRSFGTCSLAEPIEELERLQVL
jgi:hypothetical protein